MKPVLLVDVDGVVNAFSHRPTKIKARGYRTVPATVELFGEETRRELVINDENLAVLLGMEEDFDLVWCSSWNEQANTVLAPIIGFPELPVLYLDPPQSRKLYDADRLFWKTRQVVHAFSEGNEYAGRQFAWLDDSTRRVDRQHVDSVFGHDHHRLVLVQSNVGVNEFYRNGCMAWKAFSFVD